MTHVRFAVRRTIHKLFFAASVLTCVAFASRFAAAISVTLYSVPGEPSSITVGPDGNLWFTQFTRDKIGQISTNGAVTEYAVPTAGVIGFDITLGPNGNLWFTEGERTGPFEVLVLPQIGTMTSGGLATEYPLPTHGGTEITAGPDGNVWFVEFDKIGKITPGGVVTEYAVPSTSSRLITGPDGNLWFSEGLLNQIGRITTSGVVTEYAVPGGPQNMTVGPDGNLWCVEYTAGKIAKITTAGVVAAEYSVPGLVYGITAGPDGNLWFIEPNPPRIATITTGGVITEYPIHTAKRYARCGDVECSPEDIVAGPDGNLWFTVPDTRQIGKVGAGITGTGSNVDVLTGTTFVNTKTNLETDVTVEVIFASATSAGITTITPTSTPTDAPPPDFTADIGLCSKTKTLGCESDDDCPTGQTCTGYHGFGFDISTTASVSGPFTVCSYYPDSERRPPGGNGYVDGTGKPGLPEQSLRLLHEEDGVFVDVTLPGYPDTLNNVVCGQVNSLSASAGASAGRTIGAVQGAFGLYVKTDMPGNGRRPDLDCISEWSLGNPKAGNPTIPKKKRGTWFFPDAQLTCKAGSTKCEAPMPGFCTFRFRVCLNTNDSRLPCQPTDVKEFQLLEPQLAAPPTDNDSINAQRILEKLGGLAASNTFATQVSFNSAVTVSVCTDNIEVTVPANAVPKSIKLAATDTNSRADTNTVKLLCNP